MPANFRTYEGQSRLLTAVIAAHPSLKLNYKDIAKYFGGSTPDGIQFQFRQIKKDAENMRQGKEVGTGGGGAPSSSATSTPAKTPKTPKTPGGRTTNKRVAPSSSQNTPTAGRSTNTTTVSTPASKRVKREQQVSDEETLSCLNADDLEMLATAGGNGDATAFDQHARLQQTPTKPRMVNHSNPQPQTLHHEPPPALDLTQATSPEDDDALTPREDPAFSFAQTSNSQQAPWAGYNNHSGNGAQAYYSSFGKNDFEDDGEV